MLLSIVAFLAFVALFTLVFRYATRAIGQRVGEWVDRRHRAAQEILDSGRAPKVWLEAIDSRFPGIATGEVSAAHERGVRRRLLRELRRLQRYFEKSPLVDSEDTRQVLIAQLRDVRERWQSASVGDLLARDESGTP